MSGLRSKRRSVMAHFVFPADEAGESRGSRQELT